MNTKLSDTEVREYEQRNMQLLFPKGATREQKIFVILLFAVAVFIPFAIFSNVLININVKLFFNLITVIASLTAIIFIIRTLSNETSIFYKNLTERGERPKLFIFVSFFSIPLILYMSISVGIPSALHHILISTPGELVVTVKSRPSSYRERYRHGGAYIEEYKSFLNDQVYGIDKADWDSLRSGDKLRLSGKKTYFGFSYNQYKLTRR